jgi:PiT family inorganic phosphate transporter
MGGEFLETHVLTIAFLLIAIVLLFEFSNGFNDCANMVVTPVITGALIPRRALLLTAAFEFIGAWFLGTAVAETLGKGIVNAQNVSVSVIFAAVGCVSGFSGTQYFWSWTFNRHFNAGCLYVAPFILFLSIFYYRGGP